MTHDPGQAAPVDPTRRRAPVVRIAPAKLNLTLSVVARRDDGYHSLHSVFAPLGLADRLSLALATGHEDTLHVSGFDPGETADNLVLRAIAATRAAVGRDRPAGPQPHGPQPHGPQPHGPQPHGPAPALAARLDKRIPVAAGLGGGSSDAAAAIDGALEAWGVDLDPHERLAVAAAVGSDVPFFLTGGLSLVEGRGEMVARLDGLHGSPGVLIVTPAVAVSTRDVFAAFDAIRTHGDGAVRLTSMHLAEELRAKLSTADLVARAGAMTVANDLLPATALVVPSLVPFRRSLSRLLGRPVGLSGSGPTLWALYASEAEAAEAATAVRTALEDGRITAPGSTGPYVGATHIQTGHQHGSQP